MIITDVKLKEQTGTKDKEGRHYKEVWDVYFSGGWSLGTLLSTTDSRLPQYGTLFSNDTSSFAKNIDAKLADNDGGVDTGIAKYNVGYEPISIQEKSSGGAVHPLLRPPSIEWGGPDKTQVIRTDVDGKAIVNSAGTFYDPMPEQYLKGADISITRNEGGNPGTTIFNYSRTTSSDAFYAVASGNALMGKITASLTSEEWNNTTVLYWRVTYPVQINRDGWKLKLIDNGFHTKTTGNKLKLITDEVGLIPVVPCLLDGAGNVLDIGGTPVIFPTAGYKIYEVKSWNTLNLPNPFTNV